MSLFHKARAEKPPVDWSRAYFAAPKFYGKPDGAPFGAIALTEGTETVLPKAPQKEYAVDGKPVADWKIVLVSTTKDCVIGDSDYFCALAKLKNYVQDTNDDAVLIRALSLEELEAIGRKREEADFLQLAFWVEYDAAAKEYVDKGCYVDLATGEIFLSSNYRPLKALKYIKEEDSVFHVIHTGSAVVYLSLIHI